jgi:tripartite-type tricarboxylate transporter receptor subunit TctC
VAGFAATAQAQDAYPERAVKVIVALPAGGSADMIARVVGQKLASELKQPFVVDNRAGASGQIGTPAVARSAPDGYTLMVSPASFLTTNKSIFKSLPYDPGRLRAHQQAGEPAHGAGGQGQAEIPQRGCRGGGSQGPPQAS